MSAIDSIELSMQEHKKHVELGKALQRLMKNQDFQKILMKGYLEQEAIRLVQRKAEYRCQNAVDQADIVKRIDAIGLLKIYFDTLMYNHDEALKGIEMDSQTLEEILLEGNA